MEREEVELAVNLLWTHSPTRWTTPDPSDQLDVLCEVCSSPCPIPICTKVREGRRRGLTRYVSHCCPTSLILCSSSRAECASRANRWLLAANHAVASSVERDDPKVTPHAVFPKKCKRKDLFCATSANTQRQVMVRAGVPGVPSHAHRH